MDDRREDDKRARMRQECRDDLDALRLDPDMPERAFRLYEKMLDRLDRLETGNFTSTEKPTDPKRDGSVRGEAEALPRPAVEVPPEAKRQRHDSSGTRTGWKNDPVFEALGVPKKTKKDGSGEDDAEE